MTVPVACRDPVRLDPDFRLADVVVRLARDDERPEWDRLMDAQHYLGFRQFAGRGLRYVAAWRGRWLALLGWQTGVFQCAPRDQWIGWHKAVQMCRLHLCANNTRFLILPAAAGAKNLGSYVLGANLRRLSADWQRRWEHPLLLARRIPKSELIVKVRDWAENSVPEPAQVRWPWSRNRVAGMLSGCWPAPEATPHGARAQRSRPRSPRGCWVPHPARDVPPSLVRIRAGCCG